MNMEPENMEPEHETLLRQRSNGAPQKKGKGKKKLLLFIIIILALGITYVFLKFNKTSDTKKVKQETVSSMSAPKRKMVDPEVKTLQIALDKLGKLFVDGNPDQYRANITDKEFEDVQKSINEVKKKELKKELSDKLTDIKQLQGQNQTMVEDTIID